MSIHRDRQFWMHLLLEEPHLFFKYIKGTYWKADSPLSNGIAKVVSVGEIKNQNPGIVLGVEDISEPGEVVSVTAVDLVQVALEIKEEDLEIAMMGCYL